MTTEINEPVGYVCPLRPRELEAARLFSQGMVAKTVAREMGISVHTVNHMVTASCRILSVNSRTELVATLLRKGWME